jgi:hypothetical protein
VRRSHGSDVIPGQQLVDIGLFVSRGDGCHGTSQIAMRFNPIEFAGLDQRRDDGPVLRAGIVTCEERVFAIEGDGTDCAL